MAMLKLSKFYKVYVESGLAPMLPRPLISTLPLTEPGMELIVLLQPLRHVSTIILITIVSSI